MFLYKHIKGFERERNKKNQMTKNQNTFNEKKGMTTA